MPEDDNFRYETCAYPSEDLDTNEVLIKTCYLSIDPASVSLHMICYSP